MLRTRLLKAFASFCLALLIFVPTALASTSGTSTPVVSWSSGWLSYSGFGSYIGDTVYFQTNFNGWSDFVPTASSGGFDYGNSTPSPANIAIYSASGSELYSNSSSQPPLPPSAVSSIVFTQDSSTSETVSWSASSGATSYQVSLNGGSPVSTTSTSYTFTGLTPNQSYSVSIVAVDGSASSSASTGTFVTVPPPESPSLNVSNITMDSAIVSWNAVSGATSYQVSVNGSVVESSTTSTSYDMTGLTSGSSYTVSVVAVNSGGQSNPASTSFDTGSIPAVPTGLQGTPANGSVTLTWSADSGNILYTIYQNGIQIATTTDAQYVVTGLTNGQAYSFTVSASNSYGSSKQSASISVTPKNQLVPLSQLSGEAGGTEALVSWVGGKAPFTVTLGSQTETVTSQSALFTGLQKSTSYNISVTDSLGASLTSSLNTGTVTKILPPPMPPSGNLFQTMVNAFGRVATIALVIIGSAVALGLIVVLSIYLWRLLKRWFSRSS